MDKRERKKFLSESMQEIFRENQEVLQLIDLATRNFNVQNFDKGLRLGNEILSRFGNLVSLYVENAEALAATGLVEINVQQINEMLMNILKVQEHSDYILLADLYYLQLSSYIQGVQQAVFQLVSENLYEDDIYSVEFCTNGDFTLAKQVEDKRLYLHSNHKPMIAAYELAKSWYKEDKSIYIIFGFGLGYHAYQLGEIDETLEIIVFEADEKVMELSEKYGMQKQFLANSKHKLIYDKEQSKLLNELSTLKENGSFVIHYPSLQLMKSSDIKMKLENYFIQYSSIQNQTSLMIGNFRENQANVSESVYKLSDSWKGKTAYIVAAGPSLDYNFQLLKQVKKENSIIIAVGTVFRKMVKEQIPIDYVVISDANERVRKQISGIEEEQIPLLLLSTTNYTFGRDYQGPKYLIYQDDFVLAEEAAKKLNGFTCKVGGSVSTVAMDLAIQMGCKRIITLGLDLAYTNNYVHATGTSRRNISDVKNLRIIKDIYGKEVYTTCSMDKYREWIEKHIESIKGVEFLNATEGGANIKGMKNVLLKDVIE